MCESIPDLSASSIGTAASYWCAAYCRMWSPTWLFPSHSPQCSEVAVRISLLLQSEALELVLLERKKWTEENVLFRVMPRLVTKVSLRRICQGSAAHADFSHRLKKLSVSLQCPNSSQKYQESAVQILSEACSHSTFHSFSIENRVWCLHWKEINVYTHIYISQKGESGEQQPWHQLCWALSSSYFSFLLEVHDSCL